MEVLEVGCYDKEDFSDKVAIPMAFLSHVLRLHFCCLLQYILDLLGLAPTKPHHFSPRAYLCAYNYVSHGA